MLENDPLWYKDAVIYEVHVRAYHDSVGDGHGDFRGLTQKLDYLVDLGVTAIWLLPFYPSPLRDDGYDIADYCNVHSQYGNLDAFRELLEAAHDRGLRLITELVINHTSDQHPWFRRARLAPPGSVERDFYVWSDSPEKYKEARIIFKDFEPSNWSWDPVAKSYYWHRFYAHQPDLNYDNPAVWEALKPVVDFWMDMGVDGMRLDAVPYLFEREGTNCENLPETHELLKSLRAHVDSKYANRMFLAEANQWPEDAVAYFGDGDECHVNFHFPLMPRLFMALHQEDRFPIHDILEQTPPIPDNCQWCLFLRNHDELTLEMVTDEERDYMYRAYTQNRQARINLGIRHRLGPLLRNDRRRIELMNALLFSLPGTPVIYYGDEIGMGDNIYLGDRNGVRTPMQWSSDRNAGFSRANPQKLYFPVVIDPEYHYETVNVESQQNNPSSLLWWMKRLIALRKRHKAFGRGSITLLRPDNPKVLAFIRKYEDEEILVVANLSRFVQFVELDLAAHVGTRPEELFGRTQFPAIGELPYRLTLGPHTFFWFELSSRARHALTADELVPRSNELAYEVPTLAGSRSLPARFLASEWDELEAILPDYLTRNQYVKGDRPISGVKVLEVFPILGGRIDVWFLVLRVERRGLPAHDLSLVLTFLTAGMADELLLTRSSHVFARIEEPIAGLLCSALAVPECCRVILRAILRGSTERADSREIRAVPFPAPHTEELDLVDSLPIHYRRSERHHTSILYGESFVLKTYSDIEAGVNPALELGRVVTAQGQEWAAPIAGSIEYYRRGAEPSTLAILQRYVPNQGSAWQFTLDQLSHFFERMAALSRDRASIPPASFTPLSSVDSSEATAEWQELLGSFLDSASLLGRRTGEMHLAVSADLADPAFAPEPFGKLYQRSLYQSMRNLSGRLCDRLAREYNQLPDPARSLALQLVRSRDTLLQRFRAILSPGLGGARIRCNGDLHLGQYLFTGKDFVVIDFEGESHRPIGERIVKRSSLRDVASMIRSFDYAVQSVLLGVASDRGRSPGWIRPEDLPTLEPWGIAWLNRVSRQFVASYVDTVRPANILPTGDIETFDLLELFLLEKALMEIDIELTDRRDWVLIPLRGAVRLLGQDPLDPALLL